MIDDSKTVKAKIVDKVKTILNDLDDNGRLNYFEITIKYIDGDMVSKVGYSDKDKIK